MFSAVRLRTREPANGDPATTANTLQASRTFSRENDRAPRHTLAVSAPEALPSVRCPCVAIRRDMRSLHMRRRWRMKMTRCTSPSRSAAYIPLTPSMPLPSIVPLEDRRSAANAAAPASAGFRRPASTQRRARDHRLPLHVMERSSSVKLRRFCSSARLPRSSVSTTSTARLPH